MRTYEHAAGPCCDLRERDCYREGHRHPGPAGPADRLVSCAVRGNATVRSRAEADGHVRVRSGVRYYFCCAECAVVFDADPLAYVPSGV